VKPQAALVGAKRRVELHPEAAIDLHLIFVINPRHPEDDLPLGFADALDQGVIGIVGAFGDDPAKAFQNLVDGLVKFGFAGVAAQNFGKDWFEFFVDVDHGADLLPKERALQTVAFFGSLRAVSPFLRHFE
jgi:hypothetical protein